MRGTYVQRLEKEEDLTDPISLDDINIHQHQRRNIYLKGDGALQLFEVESLMEWVKVNPINPLTRKPLDASELEYINFYYEAYMRTKDLVIDNDYHTGLYHAYIEKRKEESFDELKRSDQDYVNAARYLLTITDFQEQFLKADPNDSTVIKNQRTAGIAALAGRPIGSWLLRYSTLNVSDDPERDAYVKKMGMTWYVLSFLGKDRSFNHRLILHELGRGWTYCWGEKGSNCSPYITNIIDLLEQLLSRNDLTFGEYISVYINK